MKRVSFPVAAMVGLLLAVSVVAAEDKPARGERPQGGPRPGGDMMSLMLLGNEKVREEIALDDEQKEKLAQLRDEIRAGREKFEGLRDLSEEERREKLREMREQGAAKMDEVRTKVKEILTEKQQARLTEISLQVRGAMALLDPQVAEKLGMTDDQRQELAEIQRETRESMRDNAGGGDREAMRDKFQAAEDKAFAVLTDEQRAKLKDMSGEKFDIDRRELFGGLARGDGPRRKPDGENKPEGDRKRPERKKPAQDEK